MNKKNVIFKCYSSGDSEGNMMYINSSNINNITATLCDNKHVKLFVEYYDDEFCVNTVLICDTIEQVENV